MRDRVRSATGTSCPPAVRRRRAALALLAGLLALPAAQRSGAEAPVASGAAAPDTLSLSLREAILTALERNPTVGVQRLAPRIATERLREQGAAFEPTLGIDANASRTRSQRFLGASRDPFELTSERVEYGASLSADLPTGTSVAARAGLVGSISSIYADQYTGDLGLTVTQSLLRGLTPGYHLASLRKVRLDLEISDLELKAVAERVAADVEKAYWDLFLAGQEQEIQERSLALAEQQLDESVERAAVGRLPQLELAAVRAEAAMRREAMIDAQSRHEQSRLRLLFLMNPPAADPWVLVPVPVDRPFAPRDTLAALDVHRELALAHRPDLLQARLDLAKNALDLARTRSGLLPRLDLFVTLGRTTYAESFRRGLPDPDSPFYTVSGGAAMELPLTRREARARHAQTRYTGEQLELALAHMERTVEHDVRSAYVEVLRAREQIQATEVSRQLQEQKVLAEQEKFRVGESTNYLVLQAQRDLVASQLDQARAMVAYLSALVDLHTMEGTLLERRGIRPLGEPARGDLP
ncbi:MAG: TolC family protein [Candidatus Latescibacterota bacterium]